MQLDEPDAELVAAALRRIDMYTAQCASLVAPYKSSSQLRHICSFERAFDHPTYVL
jgi:hypothetical protein